MSGRATPKSLPGLVLGGVPRVNLIPPEVGERARRRRTRGYLVIAVIAVIGLVVAGYALATLRAITVQYQLDAEKARTAELLAEREEFAETAAISRAVTVVSQTRLDATSGEVVWADVLDEITAVLGPNAYVEFAANAPPPWAAPIGEQHDGIVVAWPGSLVLTFLSTNTADSTALYRRILELDVTARMAYELVELPSGEATYRTTIEILLSPDALAERFTSEEGGDDEGQ